jgi:hypothetical protein
VNQYAPNLLERRERFIKEKPTREDLSNEFGIDSFSAGILMMYFGLVVMLKRFTTAVRLLVDLFTQGNSNIFSTSRS